MNLIKDTYLYIAELSDDKTTLNMLLVNKYFHKFFVQVFKNKYPFLMKFRKNETWREFYLKMIYYIFETNLSFKDIKNRNINPKEYYINNHQLYFYFGDPKKFDSTNDYDFAIKYDKIQKLTNTFCVFENTPTMVNILNLDPDVKIHVFKDIECHKNEFENLHKSKIYKVKFFKN